VGYPFEDLHVRQFEDLAGQAMRKLFGAATQQFATGPDGGRDALFDGTAELFPSRASPWVGKTVGQAKHTLATNAHFSDPDFSGGSRTSVLANEIIRIKKLVVNGQIDNYILFSNRRLGGTTGPKLTTLISTNTGIAEGQIFLAGVEFLDALLDEFLDILRLAKIDPFDGPLLVASQDLAEIILAIADELPPPARSTSPVERVSFAAKNELNSMTPEFAKTLEDRYLAYTAQIDRFLAEPANADSLLRYEAVVEDFQLKVVAKRRDYQTFDNVFNHLVALLVNRDGVLGRNRSLVRAMLFYMYWHCDVGLTPDAATE
jgi:hypothetical protein